MYGSRVRVGLWLGVSAALLAVAIFAGCARPPAADLVLRGGTIYPLAGEPPSPATPEPAVEAVAVRAGRIVAAGSERDLRRWTGRTTRVIDLQGHTVIPGLVDAHVHLSGIGRRLREVNLEGTTSWDECVARVRDAARTAQPGAWVTGRGWDQNDWAVREFPDHQTLSDAVPDQPVYLRRVDGHAAIANATALALAGVDARSADPAGGRIGRRPDGTPSGVLVDGATELVSRHIPVPAPAERQEMLAAALTKCVQAGLTGVHDAGMSVAEVEAMHALLAAHRVPLRVYAMWDATPDAEDAAIVARAAQARPQPWDSTQHFALQAAKLMVDGALGSRGAALLEPYTDAPDSRGLPQYTAAEFLARAKPLYDAGFQLATHCIGDAANRMVLDAYEQLTGGQGAGRRLRIEHAQVLSEADLPRFAALGVLPSMQPTHCTSDMPWAQDRVGAARVRGAYAWRRLRDTGVRIPAGSDAPVESVEPLLGLYAAVTRQDAQGNPAGGWFPDQRLTMPEALRAFTSWAAYASFSEADLGTLEVGKRADFVILDRDPCRVAPAELLSTQVLATYVGGEAVFTAEAPPR